VLADMVRTDAHQLRLIAADSPAARAVKVVARAYKTLIWERSRQVHRLRYQLRDFFPAALEAYADLDAPDVLELLAKAPEPASAVRLTTAQINAALKRAGGRGNIAERTIVIRTALRSAAGPAAPSHYRERRRGPGAGRGHYHLEPADQSASAVSGNLCPPLQRHVRDTDCDE
jgi:hypothetical protein